MMQSIAKVLLLTLGFMICANIAYDMPCYFTIFVAILYTVVEVDDDLHSRNKR